MDVQTWENPMGTDGFEFVEYAAPDPKALGALFETMGFTAIARHRHKDVTLYRQGDINFIINAEPGSFEAQFAVDHGPCACAMAFRVKDAKAAHQRALSLGATNALTDIQAGEMPIPAIEGIGGSRLYFVDQYGKDGSIYDTDFAFFDGWQETMKAADSRLTYLDHLTHNVYGGRMAHWASFYERIAGFREIRYFDIKGEYTGLTSKAMTAPDGKIRIPLNEEGKAGGGQIEEFLRAYNGEGIQHIALICDDLIATWDRLKALGVPFMTAPPTTYYEMLEERLPGHGEPVDELQSRGILLDGSTENDDPRLLLQIFGETQIGPVFFEFIQRKKDEGFGEGNFTALFQSIERDQMKRGVLGSNNAAKETVE